MGSARAQVLAGVVVADLASTLEVAGIVTLLAALVGLGVAAFVWARNWRRQWAEESTPEAQIESYRHMLDTGLIGPHEFERIQARLLGKQPSVAPPAPDTGIQEGAPPRPTDLRAGPPSREPPSEPT